MSAQTRCRCQSCTIRGLMGPAILITLGILFLLNQTHGGRLQFDNTWPVILLVIGLILFASSLAPRDGHIDPPPQTLPPGVPPPPPVVPPQAPQAPYSGQGQ
jgi:hypothetical protein